VPRRHKEDPALGNWIQSQRKQNKEMRHGGHIIDTEPVDMLEHLGFAWSNKYRLAREGKGSELLEFKQMWAP
jgi:hypothetical protein